MNGKEMGQNVNCWGSWMKSVSVIFLLYLLLFVTLTMKMKSQEGIAHRSLRVDDCYISVLTLAWEPGSLGPLFFKLHQFALYPLSCLWNFSALLSLKGLNVNGLEQNLFPVNSIFFIVLDLNPFYTEILSN